MHNNSLILGIMTLVISLSFIRVGRAVDGVRDEIRRTSNICIGSAAVPSSLNQEL